MLVCVCRHIRQIKVTYTECQKDIHQMSVLLLGGKWVIESVHFLHPIHYKDTMIAVVLLSRLTAGVCETGLVTELRLRASSRERRFVIKGQPGFT